MSKSDKRWERVDELGEQWVSLPPEGNEAARKTIENEIFIELFELYQSPTNQEALMRFFEQDWAKAGFHPERAQEGSKSLSSFVKARINNRIKDAKNEGKHSKTLDEGGEKKKCLVADDSLDQQLGDEASFTRMSTHIDERAQRRLDDVGAEAQVFELISIMLSVSDRLHGRANNAARKNYFRMFFTDDITHFVRGEKELACYLEHERDLFSAMKLEFLDFFVQERCRHIPALALSPLRLYGELVEGREMEECKQPLPADVYITYLSQEEDHRANASAISQQKNAYKEFLAKELGVRL